MPQFDEDDRSQGNGNGKGAPGLRARLEKKFQYYQERAHALRLTLEMLDEDLGKNKVATTHSMLQRAVQIDQERRAKKNGHDPAPFGAAAIREQRTRTADLLATISKTEPRTDLGVHGPVLARTGYLKKKGDGYVRTGKVFQVARFQAPRVNGANKSRRQHTAKVLAKLSRTIPTPKGKIDTGGISILTQHGYLKATPDGYLRTDKEFTP